MLWSNRFWNQIASKISHKKTPLWDPDCPSNKQLIKAFIAEQVHQLLKVEVENKRIFIDETCTSPKTREEFQQLADFSYSKIMQTWQYILAQSNTSVPIPRLIFKGNGITANEAFQGMSYNVSTETIVVDTRFLDYFKNKVYSWAEDFSVFYAIAHEVWHHMQKHLFWNYDATYNHEWKTHIRAIDNVLDMRVFSLLHHFDSAHQAEQIVELHADYLAWVLAHHANRIEPFLHENDIREWLETALHVWDDMRELKEKWFITPESHSHGRCDQRVLAFARWFETWDPFLYSLEDICRIFFQEWARRSAHLSVTMF